MEDGGGDVVLPARVILPERVVLYSGLLSPIVSALLSVVPGPGDMGDAPLFFFPDGPLLSALSPSALADAADKSNAPEYLASTPSSPR